MKYFIVGLLIASSNVLIGQETIIKKNKNEVYSVLKADNKVKHGTYTKRVKKTILEIGKYDNNRRVGIWEFYDLKGNIEQRYNYTSGALLLNNSKEEFFDSKISEIEETTKIKPDKLPIFIGGRSRYFRFIEENLQYPSDSRSKKIEGKQFVLVTLSKKGEIVASKIYRVIASDINKEALRLIKELPNEWLPAQHNGVNIPVIISLPVLFRLN